MVSQRYGKKVRDNRRSARAVMVVVLILIAVMSVNIVRLYHKDQEYAQKEALLKSQYTSELDRSKDLKDYEKFTKTVAYVEQVAREKLGLVFKNEIVFRSKNAE